MGTGKFNAGGNPAMDPIQGEVEILLVALCFRNDLEYFHSPLDGMLVHRRVTHSIKFAGTHSGVIVVYHEYDWLQAELDDTKSRTN